MIKLKIKMKKNKRKKINREQRIRLVNNLPVNKESFFKKIKLRFILIFIFSFVLSFLSFSFLNKKNFNKKNIPQKSLVKTKEKTLIIAKNKVSHSKLKDYLKTEQDLYLDPITLIELINNKSKEILVFDVRKKEAYQKEHLKGAIFFESLTQVKKVNKNKKKTIIIYGDFSSSVKPKQIALTLLENGFSVKILSIGYNEFRHLKVFWLPQDYWDKINPDDYLERIED